MVKKGKIFKNIRTDSERFSRKNFAGKQKN